MAACSGDNRADDEPDGTSSTSTETTETTSVATSAEEQEIIDAYLAAGEAFDEAAMVPDPDYPLEETHTGPMLQQDRRIIEGLASDGLVLEYPDDSQASETATSVRIDGDVAYLEVCGIGDGRRVRQDTGEIVVGGGVATVWATVAMQRVDGVWKLAERREDDRREGVVSCQEDG